MNERRDDVAVWVIASDFDTGCRERLGDARRIADGMDLCVGVLVVANSGRYRGLEDSTLESLAAQLIPFGADIVLFAADTSGAATNVDGRNLSPWSKVETTIVALCPYDVQIVFAGGDPHSREWAALLAAKQSWQYLSPALMVRPCAGQVVATQLDFSGRKSRQISLTAGQTAIVTMRVGVADELTPDHSRRGQTLIVPVANSLDTIPTEFLPADPATSDIRDVKRLVAGGRGLGSRKGFDLVRDVARLLDAGVAASRIAVDAGWIEADRQVGQTGKTVAPDIYIACGISGASHHLEGMRNSSHIIAINQDRNAPIMNKADLGLVADLYPVLEHVKKRLAKD